MPFLNDATSDGRGRQDFLRPLVHAVIQEFLEAEMAEAVGAEKGERAEGRLSYRSGYYPRSLITRVGKLELRIPQDRNGRFSTEIFERYQRSEKALVAALTEMYIQGVSTRKVKAISEELCGHSFSASRDKWIQQKTRRGARALCPSGARLRVSLSDPRCTVVERSALNHDGRTRVIRSRAMSACGCSSRAPANLARRGP